MIEEFKNLKNQSLKFKNLSAEIRTEIINSFADAVEKNCEKILQANRIDLDGSVGLSDALKSRLTLTKEKILDISRSIRQVGSLYDPVNKEISRVILDEGLVLNKITVPLGVIGIIYESRPDVTPQIISLAARTGNCVILKGGKEALNTNRCFVELYKSASKDITSVLYLESRESAALMLDSPEYIDLIIPRGSNQMVQDIQAKSKVPVLGHADGVCHIYVDKDFDADTANTIILDSKLQYPAACNAVETVLIHKDIATALVPIIVLNKEIEFFGCDTAVKISAKIKALSENFDWHTEYGAPILSVKVVDNLDGAIEHINKFGSHHTDVVLTNDEEIKEKFFSEVDSASVFHNCSSRFADGFRFGLGAEVGISTGKIHARGPVGIEGLMTTQFRLSGSGQVVKDYVGTMARKFLHSA